MLAFAIVVAVNISSAAAATNARGSIVTSARLASRCEAGAFHAVIVSKHLCMKSGRSCSRGLDAQYHSYEFHCHGAALARDPWAALRRPLSLPAFPPGTDCPRNAGARVDEGHGPALGDGPVYAVGFRYEGKISVGLDEEGGWRYWKVIFIRLDGGLGPLLVRGQRLGAPSAIRFGKGPKPVLEARLAFKAGNFEAAGTRFIRMREPGCYALQLDGMRFSDTLVFEADFVPRP